MQFRLRLAQIFILHTFFWASSAVRKYIDIMAKTNHNNYSGKPFSDHIFFAKLSLSVAKCRQPITIFNLQVPAGPKWLSEATLNVSITTMTNLTPSKRLNYFPPPVLWSQTTGLKLKRSLCLEKTPKKKKKKILASNWELLSCQQ